MRDNGDWEGWLRFFLEGIRETAQGGVVTATRILRAFKEHEASLGGLGQRGLSATRVLRAMQKRPVAGVAQLAERTDLSEPTVRSSLGEMEKLGLIREITGRKRDRVFAYWPYWPYIEILNEGAEPLR